MATVTLPKKFGDIPITKADLVSLGLIHKSDQKAIESDEFWYIKDRFDPGMVPCWTFPLNPELKYFPGNQQVTLLENGVRTSTWLREATFLIAKPDGTELVRWVRHEFQGSFIIRFFDWTTGRDRKTMEL